jgi:hypothetical protein
MEEYYKTKERVGFDSRTQYPRGLKHELSSLARTLESWARIPLRAWMSVRLLYDYV